MNENPACPDLEELAAWIDGRVDEPARSRLAAHVAGCDRCAEVVEEVLAFNEESELAEDGAAAESDFAPVHEGYSPLAARVRWKPYLAAALTASVMAVGFLVIQQRAPNPSTLLQELEGLELNSQIDRSASPLTEKELPVAKKCRLFLKSEDTARYPNVRTRCLDLVAQDPDLASQVVVEAPGFNTWLGSSDPLGASSCKVLETAWEHLRKTRQDELRPHRETCQARLGEARH